MTKNILTIVVILICFNCIQAAANKILFQKTNAQTFIFKNGKDRLVFDLSKDNNGKEYYIILNEKYKININFSSSSSANTLYGKTKEKLFYVKEIDKYKIIKDKDDELIVTLHTVLTDAKQENDFNLTFIVSISKNQEGFSLETRIKNLSTKNVIVNVVNNFTLLSDKFQGENSSIITFERKRASKNSKFSELKWAKLLYSKWIFLHGNQNDDLGIISDLKYFEQIKNGHNIITGVKTSTVKQSGDLYNRLILYPTNNLKSFLSSVELQTINYDSKIINKFWRSKIEYSWKIRPKTWKLFKYQKYGKSILPNNNIGLALWTIGIKYKNNKYICSIDNLCKALKATGFNILPLQVWEKEEYFLKTVQECVKNGFYVTLMRNFFKPFKYHNKASSPLPKEFLSLAKKMQSITGNKLLGISDIEYDGILCRPKMFSKHASALHWEGSSENRHKVYNRAIQYFRSLYDKSEGKNKIKYLSHCESSMQYILAESGADLIGGITYGNKMNTELSLAFTRGTCRQYDIYMGTAPQIWGGKPFNWYPGQPFWTKGRDKFILPVLDGKKNFTKCRFCGAPEKENSKKMYSPRDLFYYCSKCGSSTGKPPEGLATTNLLSYFSGCRYFEAELHAHAYIHIKPPFGPLPYGKAYTDIKTWHRIYKRPGDPVTPIAVMVDPTNGWNAPYKYFDSRIWSRQQWMGHEETMFKYFEFFYPYCLGLNKQPQSQDFPGSFTYTPYGQIDVITSKIDLDKLNNYHCILALGWYRVSEGLLDKLHDYVKNGGMLIMNIEQLKQKNGKYVKSSQIEKLFGVKISKKFKSSTSSFFVGIDKKDQNEEHYKFMPLKIVSAESVAYASSSGKNTIISCKRIGKGLAFLTGMEDMTSISGNRLRISDRFLKFMTELNADGVDISPAKGIEYILTKKDNDNYNLFFTFYGTKILKPTPFNINKPMKGVENWSGKIKFDKRYFKIKHIYKIKELNGIKEKLDLVESENEYIIKDLKLKSFDHNILQIVTE